MATKSYVDSDGLTAFANNINTAFAKKTAVAAETTARTNADQNLQDQINALDTTAGISTSDINTICSTAFTDPVTP